MTLAMLPLQNEPMPSDFMVLMVQSTTPEYGLSRIPCLSISDWFWTKSLTRSMGAAAVLETAAATPDNMKFSANPNFCPPPILICLQRSWSGGKEVCQVTDQSSRGEDVVRCA